MKEQYFYAVFDPEYDTWILHKTIQSAKQDFLNCLEPTDAKVLKIKVEEDLTDEFEKSLA